MDVIGAIIVIPILIFFFLYPFLVKAEQDD